VQEERRLRPGRDHDVLGRGRARRAPRARSARSRRAARHACSEGVASQAIVQRAGRPPPPRGAASRMSGSPISRCTTLCPAASRRLAARRGPRKRLFVPSVSSRAAECIDDPVGDNETPGRAPGVGHCHAFTCAPAPMPYPIGGALFGGAPNTRPGGGPPALSHLSEMNSGHLDRPRRFESLGRLGMLAVLRVARRAMTGEVCTMVSSTTDGSSMPTGRPFSHSNAGCCSLGLQPVGVIARTASASSVCAARNSSCPSRCHVALIAITRPGNSIRLVSGCLRPRSRVAARRVSKGVPGDEVAKPHLNEGAEDFPAWR